MRATYFSLHAIKSSTGDEGGGKSWAFAIALLTIGMSRPIRVLCARELQVSIADSVHKLLSDVINANPGMGAFYTITQKTIVGQNGTEFAFKGLKHNSTEIKSFEGVDYCWVEEAQAVSHKSWETLIPTIRKEGSEIWICFNDKNATDPTYERFVLRQRDNAIVKKVNWRDNPFFPKVLDDERRDMEANDPQAYEHVWEGGLDTRYSGAVYAKWIAKANDKGRISPLVKHDPAFPVYTSWDLGYDDATSIIFYQIGSGEVFIIDYLEDNFEDIKYYCEVLAGREIIIEDRILDTGEVTKWRYGADLPDHMHRKMYTYHTHYAPHDAAYKIQAAGGRSIISQADSLGVKMFAIPATSQQNNIEALRETIPKCWINADRCKDLVAALMNYHFDYDEDRKIFSKEPVHDWSSHAADAAELMGRVWQGKGPDTKELHKRAVTSKFHRLRQQHNMDNEDPYRTRKA